MPAGNWDYHHNVNAATDRVEWPKGPMKLAKNEKAKWLEAWVIQRSTGASQRTYQSTFPSRKKWTAPKGVYILGKFKAGPALGIAMLSTHNSVTKKDDFYWWVDEIYLT
jgi:hypothetical protein